MSTPLLELEGTVDEIRAALTAFAGQRLHITVRPVDTPVGTALDARFHKLRTSPTITAPLFA